ncbi:MAG: glycerol-3-phosphate acyltransferase [Lachnospiraceae bacterium]|nr:glycerol-3-phosphate acyltransferase [Lachnospiraceae bacterium]
MKYLLIILIAYLMGCSSMSFYLMKLKHTDLRDKGSQNLGASNAMLVMGWKYGILVAVHDIGKAALAVILAKWLFPDVPYIGFVAGVSSVLGHIFPFYLKFKGGKGFASYIGMTLALNWKFALILILIVALVTLITDYIVVGTTLTVISVPIYYSIITLYWMAPAILCIATAVILYKHRANFVRIVKGTEIGLRSANRGDHRV